MKIKTIAQMAIVFALFTLLFLGCQKQDTKVESTTNAVVASIDLKSIEVLCNEYFSQHPNVINNSKTLISVTNEFLGINRNCKEFKGKQTCKIQPIYAHGIDGVAYYEIWFTENNSTPKGWILVSVTDKDYPLVNFSNNGLPYSYQVMQDAAKKNVPINEKNKIYRFGVSYFTLEGENGERLAEHGKMPQFIHGNVPLSASGSGDSRNGNKNIGENVELIEGVHYFTIDNYESLKNLYSQYYFNQNKAEFAEKMRMQIFPKQGHGVAYNSSKDYIYRWVSGQHGYYTQIPAHSGYNTTDCYSGCNNNAWLNIFGWWDLNMSKSNLIPTTSTGETCPLYRDTQPRMDVLDPAQMSLRSLCGTFCSSGEGATLWSDAYKGYKYVVNKGYGYSYNYQWCLWSGCSSNLADILTDCIGNNYRPAQVGANSHFYVGYGYAQWADNTDWTWAYCYPGWSTDESDDVWISWNDMYSAVKLFVY
jgi:hypothetical protein